MKHFFIIHSSITWLIAQKIMEQEKLQATDCVLLTDRSFPKKTTNIQTVDISDLFLYDIKSENIGKIFIHYRRNLKTLAQIDSIVARHCPKNKPFYLYLSHQKNYKYFAFFTHPQCQRFFYIEEGALTYAGNQFDNNYPWFKKLVLSILYRIFLKGRVAPFPNSFDFKHPKYGGAYGLSEWAFPGAPKVSVLPLPFTEQPELKNIHNILVFGPYVEFGEKPQEVRLRVTREFFEFLIREKITEIHYKFHPTQLAYPENLEPLRSLIQEYSDRIHFQELTQEIALEDAAFSSHANFYLITSSVAIYAILCGSRVISYAPQVVKYYPRFQKMLDAIPKQIRKKIEFIEL